MKYIKTSKGSSLDMIDAIEDRISELEMNSSTNINASYDDSYLDTLEDVLRDELGGEVDSWKLKDIPDRELIKLQVRYGSKRLNFEFTYDELGEPAESAAYYIANTVIYELDNG